MLTCFVFYGYLTAAEKENKQETSEVFLTVSLEWLNKVLFGKEIRRRARAWPATLLANQDMLNVYLSVH